MRSLPYLICLLLFAFGTRAQVKVGATPTGKHARVLNTAKASKEEIKERKEQAKQIQEQVKAREKYKRRFDKEKIKYQKRLRKDSLGQQWKVDSLAVDWGWSIQDSLRIAEEVWEKSKIPDEYREFVSKPPVFNRDSLSFELDSTAVANNRNRGEELLENKAKEYLPGELGQEGQDPLTSLPSNPVDGLENPGLETPSVKKPSKPNPNLVKPEVARDLFKKIDPEQFQKVQQDITKLKKKYSSLPDTRFPEEGRKRNSLEDLPFKKRVYLGGQINLASTDPLILDANIQIGYWINKKWLAGTGLIVREQFNDRDSTSLTKNSHGYSFFTRYDIKKGFFLWGESQRQVNRSLLNNESNLPVKWQEAYLLGVGREFKIGPVRMNSLVMYDFNYQSNTLNNRPWVVRLGFQLSKKPE